MLEKGSKIQNKILEDKIGIWKRMRRKEEKRKE